MVEPFAAGLEELTASGATRECAYVGLEVAEHMAPGKCKLMREKDGMGANLLP